MGRKKNPHIVIKNIQGNVVSSQNQSGGVTAHELHPVVSHKKPFYETVLFWVATMSSVLGILAYFGFQPKYDPHSPKATYPTQVKSDAKRNIVKLKFSLDTPKYQKKPTKKKSMFNKDNQPKETGISVDNVKGDVTISQNQTGGVTAHTININTERHLTQQGLKVIFNDIEKIRQDNGFGKGIAVYTISYSNAPFYAQEIMDFFKNNGYDILDNGTAMPTTSEVINGLNYYPYQKDKGVQIYIGVIK
jgi:hypothetical protein